MGESSCRAGPEVGMCPNTERTRNHEESSPLSDIVARSWVRPFLLAQADRATIEGIVTDASGAAIADAKVSVIRIETNSLIPLKTNEVGRYYAANLPLGTYRVTRGEDRIPRRPGGQPDPAIADERPRGREAGGRLDHRTRGRDRRSAHAGRLHRHHHGAADHQADPGTAADHRGQEARHHRITWRFCPA